MRWREIRMRRSSGWPRRGRGVLTRHGADLIGLCPFPHDREPSLVISPAKKPDKNLWHCLCACQAGGSVIDWTMRAHGVSFRHAVELLRDELLLAVASNVKSSRVRKLKTAVDTSVDAMTRECWSRWFRPITKR